MFEHGAHRPTLSVTSHLASHEYDPRDSGFSNLESLVVASLQTLKPVAVPAFSALLHQPFPSNLIRHVLHVEPGRRINDLSTSQPQSINEVLQIRSHLRLIIVQLVVLFSFPSQTHPYPSVPLASWTICSLSFPPHPLLTNLACTWTISLLYYFTHPTSAFTTDPGGAVFHPRARTVVPRVDCDQSVAIHRIIRNRLILFREAPEEGSGPVFLAASLSSTTRGSIRHVILLQRDQNTLCCLHWLGRWTHPILRISCRIHDSCCGCGRLLSVTLGIANFTPQGLQLIFQILSSWIFCFLPFSKMNNSDEAYFSQNPSLTSINETIEGDEHRDKHFLADLVTHQQRLQDQCEFSPTGSFNSDVDFANMGMSSFGGQMDGHVELVHGDVDQDGISDLPERDGDLDSVAQTDDDTDSAYDNASLIGDDTKSLASYITNYRVEHGRRYHAFKDGAYWVRFDA
jgi:hypothetical protein